MNLTVEYSQKVTGIGSPTPTPHQFSISTMGQVVREIGSWVGWRRLPLGLYVASPWVSSVLSVQTEFPGFSVGWSGPAATKRDQLLKALSDAKLAIGGGVLSPQPPAPTARSFRLHQIQALNAARAMGWRCMLTDDMGLGKTSTALWCAGDSKAMHILVICPVSVKYNWQKEIALTIGEDVRTIIIDGTQKQRVDQIADIPLKTFTDGTAVIINYDLLRHLSEQQRNRLMEFARGEFVILDESHYLKSRDSERSELVKEITKHASFVMGLTGTPIRNMPDDLFSQVDIIRPGVWSSYTDFERRHLVITAVQYGNTKRPVRKIAGVKNLDELNAVMNTMQIRRKKADVLDLPPKVYTYPELQLDDVSSKVYAAMKKFAMIELKALTEIDVEPATGWPFVSNGQPTIWHPRARTGVQVAMRCEQIAQGFVGGLPEPVMAQLSQSILKHAVKIPGRPNELVFPEAPKLRWTIDAVESVLQQGGAPIVYSRFNAPMFWLDSKMSKDGVRVGLLHGALSAASKAAVIDDFQSGVTQVLICQVKIAEGWNAVRSQDVLFLGRDWSPAINAQAEDRTHRMGQKGTVNVQIPIVRGTIEAMIHTRLASKDADAQQALRSVTIAELLEAL